VEAAGQQHPGLGVGQFGHQCHRQGRRVDQRQRRGQFVLGGLPAAAPGPFGGVGQRGQPLALRSAGVGVDGDGAGHHRAARQRTVERLPTQVVAHVQPVEAVGGLVSPGTDEQHDHQQDRQRDDQHPRHVAT
jgi:hypothetical protein